MALEKKDFEQIFSEFFDLSEDMTREALKKAKEKK